MLLLHFPCADWNSVGNVQMQFVARGSMPHAVSDDGAMLYHGESGKGTSAIAPPYTFSRSNP